MYGGSECESYTAELRHPHFHPESLTEANQKCPLVAGGRVALTGAGYAVADPARPTAALEAPCCVGAQGVLVAVVSADLALVNICGEATQTDGNKHTVHPMQGNPVKSPKIGAARTI